MVLFFVLVAAGAAVGGVWALSRILAQPEVRTPPVSPADGFRAQQKIFQAARRPSSSGPSSVALSEAEATAFLGRHLADAAALPLSDVGVRFRRGVVEITAGIPSRYLLGEGPFPAIRDVLPGGWLERRLRLRLDAEMRVEPGAAPGQRRYLRSDVTGFWLGRQRIPVVLLRQLLPATAVGVLRIPVPERIEAVTIEPGRLVIRTAS